MYYPSSYVYHLFVQNTVQTQNTIQIVLNMAPNSLQDSLLRLSSLCPLRLFISELLLIDLVSSTIEIHLPWINGSLALFPSPDPEKEGEEGYWQVITIEKRLTSSVAP